MDNQNSFFPFNGQFPNLNMNEVNLLMKQFSQLMEGDFMESLQRLAQMQSMVPMTPSMPIMPYPPPNTGSNTGSGSGSQAGTTTTPPIPPFNMGQLNAMMGRLSNFLNNDLMRNMYNMQSNVPNFANTHPSQAANQARQNNSSIPIQLWENDQNVYVLASLPGLKNNDDVKVTFLDEKRIRIRTKSPTYRPEKNSRMVQSEFPRATIEREVELPQPVSTKSYSSTFKDGLYTLTLQKKEDDYDISIFEE